MARGTRASASALALLLVGSASASALAQAPLDEAVAALERGEIEPVGPLLDRALADPASTRGELARAYLYLGFVEDRRGHATEGEQALELALLLEPTLQAAGMMPSSFRARLEAVRARLGGARLGLGLAASGREVRVAVEGARDALVGRVEVEANGWREAVRPPGPWVLRVPEDRLASGATAAAQVRLFAPTGALLAQGAVELEAPVSALVAHVVDARRLEIDLARPDAARAIEAWVGERAAPRWLTRLTPPGPFTVEVPGSAFERDVVEVSLRALGADDLLLEESRLAVPRSRGQEVWEDPFFWTVIGALVVGGVVAGVVVGTADTRFALQPTIAM